MALTKVIGAGLGEVTESSSLTYGNSQASIVVQDDTNPNIVINDTGQSKDYFIVANGSKLAFNYADGGGSSSASNVTQLMSMDNSGAITKPNQPAFSVKPASKQTNIAVGSALQITMDSEAFDVNSDYSTSDNAFNAPVTGKYQLNATIMLDNLDSAATYYQINLVTSNRTYFHTIDPDFGQDAVYYSLQISALADMDASDTARLNIQQVGGTQQTDVHEVSTFTGCLVA